MTTSPSPSPSTSPAGQDRSQPKRSRSQQAPLTEIQKKVNHINSEKKRRGALRASFEKLTTMVPGTEGRAASEMFVLDATIDCIREELMKRKALVEELERRGLEVAEGDKEALKQLELYVNPTKGDWAPKARVAGGETPQMGGRAVARGKKRASSSLEEDTDKTLDGRKRGWAEVEERDGSGGEDDGAGRTTAAGTGQERAASGRWVVDPTSGVLMLSPF